MRISLYSCAGCDAITQRAGNFHRFRGSRWCPSCNTKVRAGEKTPREIAEATGGDTRGGLTKMLDKWAGEDK